MMKRADRPFFGQGAGFRSLVSKTTMQIWCCKRSKAQTKNAGKNSITKRHSSGLAMLSIAFQLRRLRYFFCIPESSEAAPENGV